MNRRTGLCLVLSFPLAIASPNGTFAQAVRVLSYQKISDIKGGFEGALDHDDRFGRSVTAIGDLDDDGVVDLAVGANNDDDGGTDRGAVWILFLNSDGTVNHHQKISNTAGNFTGILDNFDRFGTGLAALGDLDGDMIEDLAVGVRYDDDGGTDRGAVWILFLNADGTVKGHQKISDIEGGFTGELDDGDWFGSNLLSQDFNGDEIVDLAVTAHGDDDGGTGHGAVWILFLNRNGTVQCHRKISSTSGGFEGELDIGDNFGSSVAWLGDLDEDGIDDLAVGAQFDDDGGTDRGAQWILFLNSDGTVKGHQKISDTEGCFAGVLDDVDRFGPSVAPLGDIDGDGVVDLAVGEMDGPNGGPGGPGATWILHLNNDGTVKAQDKISGDVGCFDGELSCGDGFGISLAEIGDFDGNNVVDLAVGAWFDDDGGRNRGAVWVLFLELPPPCPADVVADCSVDVLDLIEVLLCFGLPAPPGCAASPGCEAEDINGDGTVNVLDLIDVLLAFGTACP